MICCFECYLIKRFAQAFDAKLLHDAQCTSRPCEHELAKKHEGWKEDAWA